MKKLFSIVFAALLLLSGMHLSMATHYCGGEIAAVKWSLVDEKATCGMEMVPQTIPTGKSFEAESCCKDEMSFLAVDNNYNPSTLQINKPVDQLLQVFYIPQTIGLQTIDSNYSSNAHVRPPGKYFASAVSLPDICVFLI